ncbi:MAG: type II secretion system protein [Chlamydiales bacterium]|nr:type II secretion system protein [Chlamydiales bacterium]
MKKRCFTLLEMMLGLALMLFASGIVFWNVHQAIKKHRFYADASKVEMQLQLAHRMAINTAVDWTFQLGVDQKRIAVRCFSVHLPSFFSKPYFIDPIKVVFNGKEAEQLVVSFSPTGCVEPKGLLELHDVNLEFSREILLPECFYKKQLSDQEGPVHPDDVK